MMRKHWRHTLVALLMIVPPLAVVPLVAWQTCGFATCPDVRRLHYFQPGGAPVLLDRSGKPFADLSLPDRRIVRLAELPKHLPVAFLAVEDQRFYRHDGVDWHRVLGAALANWKSGGLVQGSSTITMQLARTIFSDQIPLEERTFRRKALEVHTAHDIEGAYSKDEILELYLNHVYMGRGMYGVENAAHELFGVSARNVSIAQAAMLAGMVKAPARYDPRRHPRLARERRDLVLAMMAERHPSAAQAVEAARKSPLDVIPHGSRRRLDARPAPYAIEQIRRQLESKLGLPSSALPSRIRTTIDSEVQRAAEEELRAQLRAIENGSAGRFAGPVYDPDRRGGKPDVPYLEGAIVVLDAKQGDVLAWVGGRDFGQSRFDRVADARRQAGSAFKPFVYAAAITAGYPLSRPLNDSPVSIKLDRKRSWTPDNVHGRHEGLISLRNALVRSNNTATVRLAERLGIDAISAAARNAGLRVDNVQPSLSLGAIGVTPLELASAYSAFATDGTRVAPRLILEVDDAAGNALWKPGVEKRRAYEPATAFLITDVLQDVIGRGTGQSARPKQREIPVAGKTGTTNDVTDAWFVGYTPDLVAAIWIGFDQPRSIVGEATAAKIAAPVWGRLVDRIYAHRAIPEPWSPPAGVREFTIDVASGRPLKEGCRAPKAAQELFINGKTPPPTCPYDEDTGYGDAVVYSDAQVEVPQVASTLSPAIAESPMPQRDEASSPDAPASTPAPVRPRIYEVESDEPSPSPQRGTQAAAPRSGSDKVEIAARPQARGSDEGSRPRRQDVAVSPPAWAYDTASRDLSGSWNLTTQIGATTVPAFQNMRLGYSVELEQRGNRIVGRGRKTAEDGRAISGPAQTAIELEGRLEGEQVVLAFREIGTRRTSEGIFSFSVSPDAKGLGGTFRSSAASTRGSAVATRAR